VENLEHRKFLKSSKVTIRGGMYVPDHIELFPGGELYDFSWVKNVKCATIVFIMSVHCSACDFNVIDQFIQRYPEFDYQLFVSSVETGTDICTKYNDPTRFHFVDLLSMDRVFNHGGGVPWVFGINNRGQIITGDVFNNMDQLERTLKPFLKVFNDRNV